MANTSTAVKKYNKILAVLLSKNNNNRSRNNTTHKPAKRMLSGLESDRRLYMPTATGMVTLYMAI